MNSNENSIQEKKFITFPVDLDVHYKVDMKDAIVDEECEQQFKELCTQYQEVFLLDSSDIGNRGLVTMDKENGDTPSISQKSYTLPLKYAAWVQKIELLDNAGITIRNILPWASPMVVVAQKPQPGQHPRRLCVDNRAVSSLLPPIMKSYSKGKGVLTLVPLPKIDEIYTRFNGSCIYSTSDMRSGYHHTELSKESKPKSAFVTSMKKLEFIHIPFGLAQVPAYFLRLDNEVLTGLDFTFGYLDDVLVFSPENKTHLEHVQIMF